MKGAYCVLLAFISCASVSAIVPAWGIPGDSVTCANTADTTQTAVDTLVFPEALYADGRLLYLDSLMHLETVPCAWKEQARFLNHIDKLGKKQLYTVVDSLFDADPSGKMLSLLNHYLNAQAKDVRHLWSDTTAYPANRLYHGWNTALPNPYAYHLIRAGADSLVLQLSGDGFGSFVMPVKIWQHKLTSPFGWRNDHNHNGLDIDLEVWDTVRSAFDGVVRVARYYEGYGRVIVVRHYNGLESTYGHLHRFKVQVGDTVSAGQLIGLGGSSGHSTGSHLHWELRFKGSPVNPLSFINYDTGELQAENVIFKKTNDRYIAYPQGTRFYTVRNGDFLYKIAGMFGTSANHLCKLNGIRRNSTLYVGQRLRVI